MVYVSSIAEDPQCSEVVHPAPKVTFSLESMKNSLLTKLVWTRWLDIDKKQLQQLIFGHLDLILGQKSNNEFLSHTMTNQRKSKQRRTKFKPRKN